MSFPLSALYDFILPLVPVVDTPLVDHAVRRAARFIATNAALEKTTLTVPTVVGQREYALVPPVGTEITSILSLRIGSQPPYTKLYPATFDMVDQLMDFPDALPTMWTFVQGGPLSVYPSPDTIQTLHVTVFTRPEMTATTLADVYFQHRELLADGALAFLYQAPAKPWTNERAAAEAYARFGRGILALRARNRAGGQASSGTMSGPQFGA